jgi:dTDP-4-amino-4,6-dideoxygalactose transaminase
MKELRTLADRYGIFVIEDASHAVGGRYRDLPIGGGQYSDITVFSFHPVKIITSGEGGLALTNSESLAEKMRRLRSHGITRDPAFMVSKSDGPWYYEQIELGFNYRMTDIQAALALSQLKRLDAYVARRNELARTYDRLLLDLPLQKPFVHQSAYSAFHLYVLRLDLGSITASRNSICEHMLRHGVCTNVHYIPVHLQPFYRKLGFTLGQFPAAESYYQEALTLPLFPTMTHEQQLGVVDALKSAVN